MQNDIESMKLEDISTEDQEKIFAWIRDNLVPGRCTRTAYGLKQPLTRETGVYITWQVMEEALKRMGHIGTRYGYKLKVKNCKPSTVNPFTS